MLIVTTENECFAKYVQSAVGSEVMRRSIYRLSECVVLQVAFSRPTARLDFAFEAHLNHGTAAVIDGRLLYLPTRARRVVVGQ
jgi:hypothetical protein